MTKSRAKAVADSQAKVIEEGGERLTLTLPAEDAARWRALVAKQGGRRGAKMAAFREAVQAATTAPGEPTDAELLRMVQQRLAARHR